MAAASLLADDGLGARAGVADGSLPPFPLLAAPSAFREVPAPNRRPATSTVPGAAAAAGDLPLTFFDSLLSGFDSFAPATISSDDTLLLAPVPALAPLAAAAPPTEPAVAFLLMGEDGADEEMR